MYVPRLPLSPIIFATVCVAGCTPVSAPVAVGAVERDRIEPRAEKHGLTTLVKSGPWWAPLLS